MINTSAVFLRQLFDTFCKTKSAYFLKSKNQLKKNKKVTVEILFQRTFCNINII